MTEHRYARYYERYCPLAPLVFARDGLLARSRVRRIALLNRMRDYLRLRDDPARLVLHAELNAHLFRQEHEWKTYDYGEGYFYQSLPMLGITGLRDSAARLEAMALASWVEGRRVLEIGCNAGFLSVMLAAHANHVHGIDINPHVIEIGRIAASALARRNATFECLPWEALEPNGEYGAVLSFANHSTYDGQTRQPAEAYFARCTRALEPGGLLLFESHAPAYEGRGLEMICEIISRQFEVLHRRVLRYGTFLDRGRTFVVARKRLI